MSGWHCTPPPPYTLCNWLLLHPLILPRPLPLFVN
jgi:hypothetical protein